MKAEKLSDALNFLDDDLIAACDNAISARKSSAAKIESIPTVKSETPVQTASRKRAPSMVTVIRIWGSVAAAAAVLIIGGIVFFTVNRRSTMSEDRASEVKHNTGVLSDDSIMAEDTLDVQVHNSTVAEQVDSIDSIESYTDNEPRSEQTAGFDNAPSAADGNGAPTGSLVAGAVVVFEGRTYIVDTDTQLEVSDDDYIGDLIGHAEDGSGVDYTDADIYEYTGQIDRFIIVYVPDDDVYYLASPSDLVP